MPISVIGAAIEKVAKEKAPNDIQTHLNELLSYLDSISGDVRFALLIRLDDPAVF